jgi:hypothetical protein
VGLSGERASKRGQADELVALADEKTSVLWKAIGMLNQSCLLTLTGKASDAVQMTLRHRRISVNGINTMDALASSYLGISLGAALARR